MHVAGLSYFPATAPFSRSRATYFRSAFRDDPAALWEPGTGYVEMVAIAA